VTPERHVATKLEDLIGDFVESDDVLRRADFIGVEVSQLLDSEEIENMFVFFARKREFVFDFDNYSPTVSAKIRTYVSFVEEMERKRMKGVLFGEDLEQMDLLRRILHNQAARQLRDDGYVPNFWIGRGVVKFVLGS